MARTVLSVALRQSSTGKTDSGSTKGNVVASIASMEKKRIPPKIRARMAKKVETLPEKKTPRAKTKVEEQESKVKQKEGGAEGLKAKYVKMIAECIFSLQHKNGSSRPAITNQLKLQFAKSIGYNEAEINLHIKLALKKGLEEGVFKMAKVAGKGSGSYKLTETEVKKLKKKKQSAPAAAKTKQQANIGRFIFRTPKSSSKVPPENETPDSKDENQSNAAAATPKSESHKSSVKKIVPTPKTDEETIVKTSESTSEAGGQEDERKLRSGSKGGHGSGGPGKSSNKKSSEREVAEELVSFSSSSPSLRRNVKK